VEFGFGDPDDEGEYNEAHAQRILLKKGDSFFVPPGNVYRYDTAVTYI
jgi:quercetin dioxygenase-like cupin family protein